MSDNDGQLSFEIYEREVLSPLAGHELTDLEQFIANLLLDASSEKPFSNEEIGVQVQLHFTSAKDYKGERPNERTIKNIIRSLRRVHKFPIVARFEQKPYGYWWAQSAEEMLAYYKKAMGRLADELATIRGIIQVNYPEYAGQLTLPEVIEEVSNEQTGQRYTGRQKHCPQPDAAKDSRRVSET